MLEVQKYERKTCMLGVGLRSLSLRLQIIATGRSNLQLSSEHQSKRVDVDAKLGRRRNVVDPYDDVDVRLALLPLPSHVELLVGEDERFGLAT